MVALKRSNEKSESGLSDEALIVRYTLIEHGLETARIDNGMESTER